MGVVHKDEATADSSNMIWATIMGGKNSVNCEEQMFEKYHCGFTEGRHVKGEMNCERGSAYQPKPSPSLFVFSSPFGKLLG